MFTGIVQEVGSVGRAPAGKLNIIARRVLTDLETGGSIAVNGVCLTVVSHDNESFIADVMPETLRRTNLGRLKTGDEVNLESPLTIGGQVGGHLVQGHIDGTVPVVSMVRNSGEMALRLQASPELMRYIVEKGFVALDGISLTVVSRDAVSFQVSIIDYTRQHSTLREIRVGALLNLEVDIIAKYVEQMGQRRPGVTVELLEKHGFL